MIIIDYYVQNGRNKKKHEAIVKAYKKLFEEFFNGEESVVIYPLPLSDSYNKIRGFSPSIVILDDIENRYENTKKHKNKLKKYYKQWKTK